MKIAINQPYFFPYLGYFQLIESVDVFLSYAEVDYTSKTWISRNRLQGSAKVPFYISLPVSKVSSRTPIAAVCLKRDAEAQAMKRFERIRQSYQHAAHADEILTWLADTLRQAPYSSLAEFNNFCLRAVCRLLNIQTRIVASDRSYHALESSLRSTYASDPERRRIERIRTITKRFSASHYHNLPGGVAIYRREKLTGLDQLNFTFLETPKIHYQQFDNNFEPSLSILDVLFHCGRVTTTSYVRDYRLATINKSRQSGE